MFIGVVVFRHLGHLKLLIVATCCSGMAADLFAQEQPVSISYCQQHMTHQHALHSVKETYRRADIPVEFIALPCKRSLAAANSGKVSGELARIAKATQLYPNLIRASSPTILIQGVVVTKHIDKKIQRWNDLADLRIGIVLGEIYAEKGTEGMNRIAVKSYYQLLSMIDSGEIDVGVAVRHDWLLERAKPEFKNSNLHQIGEPVFSAPLYHMLNKRHADLLPKLDTVFEQMWQSGDAQRIHEEFEAKMLNQTP